MAGNPGDEFRDTIAAFLQANGYDVETEFPLAGKNVDVFARKQVRFRSEEIAIEAKDYSRNLPLGEVHEFVRDYGNILQGGYADTALLVTRRDITPQGKQAIGTAPHKGLKHVTWANFQRELFGPNEYLQHLILDHETAGIRDYYIDPKVASGESLRAVVRRWLDDRTPPPLVVLGGYGSGKSTFAATLARELAEESLRDVGARIPILVTLGEITDESSLDGLFGKLLASRYRVDGYHFQALRALNRNGRLVIIFDGLDEMKHGMTFDVFERECLKLFELNEGDSRIVLLGRPNAFPSDREFQSVIKGRKTTPIGGVQILQGRPECEDVSLIDWNPAEARSFVERYFRWIVKKDSDTVIDRGVRLNELLSPKLTKLISRPVHAQMLCALAASSSVDLSEIDEFSLYYNFIDLLLKREQQKKGRDPKISVDARRRFNACVSWWLLVEAGALGTRVNDIPFNAIEYAMDDLSTDLDNNELRSELAAGCLVEKTGGVVYFGHRSIQEFLAAEYLFMTDMLSPNLLAKRHPVKEVCVTAGPEVSEFLAEFYIKHEHGALKARRAIEPLSSFTDSLPLGSIRPYLGAYRSLPEPILLDRPWLFFLDYLSRFDDEEFDLTQASYLLEIIAGSDTTNDVWLAAVQLLCHGFLRTDINPVAKLTAALLSRGRLDNYVGEALKSRKRVPVSSDDVEVYCMISSVVDIENASGKKTPALQIDKLLDVSRHLLGFGVVSSDEQAIEQVKKCLEIKPSQIKPQIGISENRQSRIDKFFSDQSVRSLVRPVIVERRSKRL